MSIRSSSIIMSEDEFAPVIKSAMDFKGLENTVRESAADSETAAAAIAKLFFFINFSSLFN